MKKSIVSGILAGLMGTVMCHAVQAESGEASLQSDEFYPSYYFGGHLGFVKTSASGPSQSFSHTNVGGHWGYRMTPNFAVELLGTFSAAGERHEFVSDLLSTRVDVEESSIGAYGIFRTTGQFYVKARLGLARSTFEYSASDYESEKDSAFGLSYGIGVGADLGNITLDLDHVVFPDVDDPIFSDLDYSMKATMLSISWAY